MRLRLARRWFTRSSTTGQLYVDEGYPVQTHVCDSLEDPVRRDPVPATAWNEAKVAGETAIPVGRYRLILAKPERPIWSPRDSGLLPLLLDVPGYTGVFIHALNTPAETRGCIGVGTRDPAVPDWIGASRAALTALLPSIEAGLEAGEVWLEIEEVGRPPDEWLV